MKLKHTKIYIQNFFWKKIIEKGIHDNEKFERPTSTPKILSNFSFFVWRKTAFMCFLFALNFFLFPTDYAHKQTHNFTQTFTYGKAGNFFDVFRLSLMGGNFAFRGLGRILVWVKRKTRHRNKGWKRTHKKLIFLCFIFYDNVRRCLHGRRIKISLNVWAEKPWKNFLFLSGFLLDSDFFLVKSTF